MRFQPPATWLMDLNRPCEWRWNRGSHDCRLCLQDIFVDLFASYSIHIILKKINPDTNAYSSLKFQMSVIWQRWQYRTFTKKHFWSKLHCLTLKNVVLNGYMKNYYDHLTLPFVLRIQNSTNLSKTRLLTQLLRICLNESAFDDQYNK